VEQAGHELHLLLHPATELLDPLVAPLCQLDTLKPGLDPLTRGCSVNAFESREVDEDFHHALVLVQTSLLRQVADPVTAAAGRAPQQLDLAGVRLEDIHQDANRARLARAVGTEKPEDFAWIHFEGQVIDGDKASILFSQSPGGENRGIHETDLKAD